MALEPITRQEQIIAGKDLEPITRMEMFLKQYGGASSGGGGGSFVLRPTVEELSIEHHRIECTTQYDEMAKTLEAGGHVSIVFPIASLGTEFPVIASVVMWVAIDGMIGCNVFALGELWEVSFTNGTYLPNV